MVSVARRFNNGRGSRLFLFADLSQLEEFPVLNVEWLDGRGNEVQLNGR